MKKVLFYLKPYIPRMSLGLVIKFIGTVMDLLLPWILSYLIDDVVPLESIPLILLWGGAMVLCAAVALITNIVANRWPLGWRSIPPKRCATICFQKSRISPADRSTAIPFHPWNPV